MFFPILSPEKNTQKLQDYIASHPERFTDDIQQADNILVAGGDGFMLHSIKQYHDYNIPFTGINFWNIGFLMNHIDDYDLLPDNQDQYITITQKLPQVTSITPNGEETCCNAVNDIIIGKNLIDFFTFHVSTEQTQQTIQWTWLVLSTAIGSTAYRHKNGWSIIDLDANQRWLMGIATMPFHHQYLTPQTITIHIEGKKTADIGIDGYSWLQTNVNTIIIENTAHQVQLQFLPSQNLHHKRHQLNNKQ